MLENNFTHLHQGQKLPAAVWISLHLRQIYPNGLGSHF